MAAPVANPRRAVAVGPSSLPASLPWRGRVTSIDFRRASFAWRDWLSCRFVSSSCTRRRDASASARFPAASATSSASMVTASDLPRAGVAFLTGARWVAADVGAWDEADPMVIKCASCVCSKAGAEPIAPSPCTPGGRGMSMTASSCGPLLNSCSA
eukprot:scaffold239573_cov28-Tisochrysis_lutea.AAC.2